MRFPSLRRQWRWDRCHCPPRAATLQSVGPGSLLLQSAGRLASFTPVAPSGNRLCGGGCLPTTYSHGVPPVVWRLSEPVVLHVCQPHKFTLRIVRDGLQVADGSKIKTRQVQAFGITGRPRKGGRRSPNFFGKLIEEWVEGRHNPSDIATAIFYTTNKSRSYQNNPSQLILETRAAILAARMNTPTTRGQSLHIPSEQIPTLATLLASAIKIRGSQLQGGDQTDAASEVPAVNRSIAEDIYRLITVSGSLSPREIQLLTRKSPATVLRALRKLSVSGHIKSSGSTKDRRYGAAKREDL